MKIIIPNQNASANGLKEFNEAPEVGVMSSISLDHNTDFWTALRKLFRCAKDEEISGIVIKNGFLFAKFHRVPQLNRPTIDVHSPTEMELAGFDLCPQCDERAYDGRICHSCGGKHFG